MHILYQCAYKSTNHFMHMNSLPINDFGIKLVTPKHLVRTDYARFDRSFDSAIETGPNQGIGLFKNLFRLLFAVTPDSQEKMVSYVTENAREIFELDSVPQDFVVVVRQIMGMRDMPAINEPVERLFFIQNQLETIYAEQGMDLEFKFRPVISLPLGSLVRLNGHRDALGDVEYFKRLYRFFGLSSLSLAERARLMVASV